jgi:HEAT repeat protein
MVPGSFSKWALALVATIILVGCGPKEEAPKVDVAAQVAALKGDATAKADALVQLGLNGPRSAPAINDIVPLLKDDSANVRRLAVYALKEIGPAAKSTIPAIKELLQDSDMNVVTEVAGALQVLDPANSGGVAIPHTMN